MARSRKSPRSFPNTPAMRAWRKYSSEPPAKPKANEEFPNAKGRALNAFRSTLSTVSFGQKPVGRATQTAAATEVFVGRYCRGNLLLLLLLSAPVSGSGVPWRIQQHRHGVGSRALRIARCVDSIYRCAAGLGGSPSASGAGVYRGGSGLFVSRANQPAGIDS